MRCGFLYIGQIIDNNNQLKNFNLIQEASQGMVTFVQYYGLCKAIPFYWKQFLNMDTHDVNPVEYCLEKVLSVEDPLKFVYNEIITRKYICIDQRLLWEQELNMAIGFHFNILHHTLVLNEYVYKKCKCNTNLCSFCDIEVEALKHLFLGISIS